MENESPEIPQKQLHVAYLQEYTIKDNAVLKGGLPTICPLTPRFPQETPFKTIAVGFNCTLACPKCNIIKKSEKEDMSDPTYSLVISCNGDYQEIPVSGIVETAQEAPGVRPPIFPLSKTD